MRLCEGINEIDMCAATIIVVYGAAVALGNVGSEIKPSRGGGLLPAVT